MGELLGGDDAPTREWFDANAEGEDRAALPAAWLEELVFLAEHTPFDAIVIAAAFPLVPPPLIHQLALDGRLVQAIGPGGDEDVVLFRKTRTGFERVASITRAHFVALYGGHAYEGAP
jgi:protein-L-isoaspartate O-methyltransferase